MENKEVLQSNNQRLENNNSMLSSILETANNLPTNVKIKLQEKEVIPITEEQIIVADNGYTGLSEVTVVGDSNLVEDNIKQGVTIFGVKGKAKTTNLKITDASYLFYSKSRLDYLEELLSACENVSDTSHMFDNCYATPLELDLSNFDTSNVTNMEYMFNQCSQFKILGLSKFNTSNVTNMQYMFSGCTSMTEFDLSNFDTSKVTSMERMFHSCSNLTKLNLNNLNAEKVKSVRNFLTSVSGLIELNFMNNLGKGYTQKTINYSAYKLDLSKCTELTHESSMNVINNLYDLNLSYDVANGGTLYTQSLVLGATNLAKLTSEEIAIATNKGWTVS